MRMVLIAAALSLAASIAVAQDDKPLANEPVPFPHPCITEVLFHVPQDSEGDPSLDGVREAVGDEFIEIANLHDRAIDIGGYTLVDRGAQITFTFPAMRLQPGEIAVVFNGRETEIPGPVGGAAALPEAPNTNFNNAWVFNLGNTSRMKALNNQNDRIVLASPDGLPVDIIMWGASDMRDYTSNPRIAFVRPSPKCSVQRVRDTGELLLHKDIDGAWFSPGWIPERVTVAEADSE